MGRTSPGLTLWYPLKKKQNETGKKIDYGISSQGNGGNLAPISELLSSSFLLKRLSRNIVEILVLWLDEERKKDMN